MDFDVRGTRSSGSDRREALFQFVTDQGFCAIVELAERFGVSEMTIRRDVARLVEAGRLRAFHGGVGHLSPTDLLGVDYGFRNETMGEAKRAIADRALSLIGEEAVIGLDAGTTTAQLANLLKRDQKLTVVTSSLPVVSGLASHPSIDLVCLGGTLHHESLSFAGPSTLAAIANLHIQTLFLAASALNERGAFCRNEFDTITKRALIDVADKVVLLADSSKFTTSAMVRICGWDAIDQVIVDDMARPADIDLLERRDVAVDVVATVAAPPGLEAVR
jgi:DeoR family transcriptional regulator of aga operon